jgi:hypothetical protein
MSIVLSVITSYQEFQQYSSTWESFRRQQNDNVICNSWDWLNTWIDIFGCSKDKLHIYIWHCEKDIVGVIPCYLKKTFAGNELRFIATGEPTESEVCSEFQDFLLNTEFKEKILTQFTNEILANKNLSAIVFDNILTTSNVYKWFETVDFSNWKKTVSNLGNRYLIPVKLEQKEQLSSFKSKNIKRHAKKNLSDIRWHVTTINDASGLKYFYQQLISEHNHSWSKRGKIGAFEHADFVAFHQEFSQKMLKDNKLVAFKLECEDEFAALFYGMIDGDTLYYYQSAVNHESKLSSAGVAMHVIALDIARKNNLAFYDLMKGSHNSYKSRYIESDIQVCSSSIYKLKYKYLRDFFIVFQKVRIKIGKILNIRK